MRLGFKQKTESIFVVFVKENVLASLPTGFGSFLCYILIMSMVYQLSGIYILLAITR